MNWFNIYGLIFIVIIMIPNIVFALKCKEGFVNKYNNKFVELFEQIGRFGSFIFVIFNIPKTYVGFYFNNGLILYLIVDSILVILYCLIWAICFKKPSIFRALLLSIIPSILFLYSGIMIKSILLIIFSLIFAPCHILISYKNAK